jgi:NitT/TauT family transport system ATP-binding protein
MTIRREAWPRELVKWYYHSRRMRRSAKLVATGVVVEYWLARSEKVFRAVDGVDLEVGDGEFVAIVGPSGCGKTTFLNAVDGLIPIAAGSLALDKREITSPGHDRAMVFQQPGLLPWRTVLGNVLFGVEAQGLMSRGEALRRAQQQIELVGLTGFEDAYPSELSGGMQQRVNLARALLTDPEMLLLDEPFAALDAQTREMMQLELLKIWNRDRKTALFITHDIKEAIYLADRVIVFTKRPGRVKDSIDIDIARPRDLRVKRDARFVSYEDRIWESIQEELAVKPERLLVGMPA